MDEVIFEIDSVGNDPISGVKFSGHVMWGDKREFFSFERGEFTLHSWASYTNFVNGKQFNVKGDMTEDEAVFIYEKFKERKHEIFQQALRRFGELFIKQNT